MLLVLIALVGAALACPTLPCAYGNSTYCLHPEECATLLCNRTTRSCATELYGVPCVTDSDCAYSSFSPPDVLHRLDMPEPLGAGRQLQREWRVSVWRVS